MGEIDAIVLAGNREGYQPVGASNKCLLEIGERPIIHYVLDALEQSARVSSIYLVGPAEELARAIEGVNYTKPVILIQQGSTVIENLVLAHQRKLQDRADPYVLILGGDVPFLTGWEVDRFVELSRYRESDCVVGFSEQSTLRYFEPYGLRFGCVYMRQFTGRVSNMILANPAAATHLDYIQRLFRLRHQRSLRNSLRLVWEILSSDLQKPELLLLTLMAQLGLQLDRLHLRSLSRLLGRLNDVERFERCASKVIGARVKTYCMKMSFGALDVDHAWELDIYRRHYAEIKSLISEQIAKFRALSP